MGEKEHFQYTFKVMYGHLKDSISEYQKSLSNEALKNVEAYLDVTVHVIVDYAERFLKCERDVDAFRCVNNAIKHAEGYTVPRTITGGLSFPISFPVEFNDPTIRWSVDMPNVRIDSQKVAYSNLFAGKGVLETIEPYAEMIEQGIEQDE